MGALHERWIDWRNAKLADPDFQRWAARFPLTRPMVRLRAARSFDLVAGFVYSQILAACVATDLLPRLGRNRLTAETFALAAGLPASAAQRLLRAAASLDLAEDLRDGRFALGAEGATLLGNPGVLAMIRHHSVLYADLADPVALLRAGKGALRDFWAYDGGDAAAAGAYSELMDATQPMVAQQVLAAYDFRSHRHLMDVGGGHGRFLATIGSAYPHLKLTAFDLPEVAARTRVERGVAFEVVAGDFLTDALPNGADIVSLVRILHDHDDGPAQVLLAAIADSLAPGGTLLIAEPLADTPGARPMGDAYFGLYLAAMGSGRPRRAAEIGEMLRAAGFRKWRLATPPLPLAASVILATR